MRLFFLLIFFLAIKTSVFGQILIKGVVMDGETEEPLPFVNVFFNASRKGTTTNMVGQFALDASGFQGQEIIFSIVGYELLTLNDYEPGILYKVYLKPSTLMLEEIVVESEDIPREEKERLFLREFLGTSVNAKECIIENLDQIRMVYFNSTKTLKVFSNEPIAIVNRSLGYRIDYFLEHFENDPNSLSYKGYSLISIDSTTANRSALRRRRSTYSGSRMHFIRTLWTDSAEDDVFELFDTVIGKTINYQDLRTNDTKGELKRIKYENKIRVRYRNRTSYFIIKPGEIAYIAENGFFDPLSITWSGNMAKYRVADLLPYEYRRD